MYEPYVNALAEHLMMELPAWSSGGRRHDNWRTSAWERSSTGEVAQKLDEHDDHDI